MDPQEFNILLTENTLGFQTFREKAAEIMFETFKVPGLFVAAQSLLALYGTGATTGIVVDSGESPSYVVPISQGSTVVDGLISLGFGGYNVTDYLEKRLKERGYSFKCHKSHLDRRILMDIKETTTYCALDFDSEMKKASTSEAVDKTYKLPDGKVGNRN